MRDNQTLSFFRLFSVELRHQFFASTRAENLKAVPTRQCQQVMRNHGMLFREVPGGFSVLQQALEGGGGRAVPVRPLADGGKLSFLLTSLDDDVLNCSSLPMDGDRERIYCFDNLTANPRDGRLLLSSDTTTPYVTAADRLPVYPLAFRTRIPSADAQVPVTLSDRWDGTIDQRTLPVAGGYAQYAIDLNHRGEGRYRLARGGGSAQPFYAGAEALHALWRFGVIEIHQHSRVPADYRFQDAADNALHPKTYTVNIDNRRTWWRYYFVHKSRLAEMTADRWPAVWPPDWPATLPVDWPATWPDDWPAQWEVVHPSAGGVRISPQPSAARQMPDGTLAVPFVSSQPLPLVQGPVRGIGLHYTGPGKSDSGVAEVENLPSPDVGALVDGAAGGDFYSDVYIYL